MRRGLRCVDNALQQMGHAGATNANRAEQAEEKEAEAEKQRKMCMQKTRHKKQTRFSFPLPFCPSLVAFLRSDIFAFNFISLNTFLEGAWQSGRRLSKVVGDAMKEISVDRKYTRNWQFCIYVNNTQAYLLLTLTRTRGVEASEEGGGGFLLWRWALPMCLSRQNGATFGREMRKKKNKIK